MSLGDEASPFPEPGVSPASNPLLWPDADVAAIWLPRFPLRVILLRHPSWDGRPLVLGNHPGPRKVVWLCSPEAERAGLRPGLPLAEVLPLCPGAIVLQPNPAWTVAVRDELLQSLRRVGPAVEAGEDRFFLDLRGLRRLYRDDLGLLERAVRVAIPPLLHPRIGVGKGKFTAFVAARFAPRAGIRVVPAAETAAFLAPRPIELLPFPLEALRQLELLGLRRIGDLAVLPFGATQARLGGVGARAWRLANGLDDEPLVPHRFAPTVRVALPLDDPLGSVEGVLTALHRLLVRAFHQPELRGRAVRQVGLQALLANGLSWRRTITFKEAPDGRKALFHLLKRRLEAAGALPPEPIEELSLEVGDLTSPTGQQPGLFQTYLRQRRQLAEAARELRARYGYVPLYHAVEVEPWSRLPERRWTLIPCDL